MKAAAELGWLSRSSSRRQRRETWSRLMRSSSGLALPAQVPGGTNFACDGWCDGCDGLAHISDGSKVQQFRGLQRVGLRRLVRTSGATGCDARFAPVGVQNSRDSAAFRRSSANLSATGATGATARFAPSEAQEPRISAAFRLRVRRVSANCEPGFAGCR